MKIVLCANTSWYLYNFRKNLIAVLQEQGHQVCAISPADNYTQGLHDLGVQWYSLKMHQTSTNPLKEIRTCLHLFGLLKKIHPDVLLTFTIKCNLYIGFFNRLLRYKHIANISGLGEVFDKKSIILTSMLYRLYQTALKHSQKVFFQNVEDLQHFVQMGILPEVLCDRIPGSGVDLSTFTPSFKSVVQGEVVFLMFGRIIPSKGYELFLRAAQALQQEQHSKSRFWILGMKDVSRKDSKELFQKILTFHNRNIITYFPETDNVLPIISQADVVVLPSQYHEGVPKSLLEAMACGKPIITTSWKGCRDTVDDGINGLLVEKGDIESLKKAMLFFMTLDTEIFCKMGKASREKAEREFNEQFIIHKYLRIINESTQAL